MPKRALPATAIPTLVAERLTTWGKCVRHQRVSQQITGRDLCERLGISHPTLQRIERGEASVNAGLYLAALHVLGVLPYAAPELDPSLWQSRSPAPRARPGASDDEYF